METLYKLTKTGALQSWSISTLNDTFTVVYGQVDGKMQSKTTTCIGKNIGRANETTPSEQAILEAKALHLKQQERKGYTTNPSGEVTILLPMKVKKYQDNMKNVIFPCYVSLKLNGLNAIYRRDNNNNLTLSSRGGLAYPKIPHLEADVLSMMDKLSTNALAGELYHHGTHLQTITSWVKKPKPGSENLTFNIFDLPDSPDQFKERTKLLDSVSDIGSVHIIRHSPVLTHSGLDELLTEALNMGYEGLVINNSKGLYQYNVRSSDAFKYKVPESDEFLIDNYNLDKDGLPVFIMNTGNQFFKAKPTGAKDFWKSVDPNTYVGKWATIEYELLNLPRPGADVGVPAKPIFIGLRDCNSKGEPNE